MDLRIIQRDDIEKNKWNGCVHYASNSKIYGFTWYLDNVSENWFGIVEGDYESVFPIVWDRSMKLGKHIYQPHLCQQLGLFSVHLISQGRLQAFLEMIPSDLKNWQFSLNDGNKAIQKLSGYTYTERDNYHLYLNKRYEDISSEYSENTRRNIKKGAKKGLYLTSNIKPEDFVDAVKKAQEQKGMRHPDSLYHTAHRIIYNCLHRGIGHLLTASNQQKEVVAGVFLMDNGAAIVNLLNFSTEEGKQSGAMAYLMDMVIQRQSNKHKYIDFEGSSIPGIARFYKSFGAERIPYYQLVQKQTLLAKWFT